MYTPTIHPESPLTAACRLGQLIEVSNLLYQGDRPDADSFDAAITSKISSMVELMLVEQAKPSANSFSLACKTGYREIVQLMIKAKAVPGPDTLSLALDTGNKHIIELVIGAEPKPDEHSLGRVLNLNMIESIRKLLDLGFKANAGVLTIACGSWRPIDNVPNVKQRYIHDDERDTLIRIIIGLADAKPDDQTLTTFLKHSRYSHFSGDQEFFCHPKVLNDLEQAGVRCTNSDEEAASILDSCLRIVDQGCREIFCQFLVNINFSPTLTQMGTYFYGPAATLPKSLSAIRDPQARANLQAKIKRIEKTMYLLNKKLTFRQE